MKNRSRQIFAASMAAVLSIGGAAQTAISSKADYAVYPDRGSESETVSSYVIQQNNFTRSGEAWATLEDDILTWDEIGDLIYEYNATVITNRNELAKDERRSMDAEAIAEYLLDRADDLDGDANDAEDTSATLAATYRAQANSLREQANSNLDDFEIIQLNYEEVEKQLALSARNQFIEYYRAIDQAEYDETYINYLERLYTSEQNKFNASMSTELEVLNAKETLDNAKADAVTNKNNINSNLQSLIVLCGWNYNDQVTIGSLPEMTAEEAADVNYETDLETARKNNITLKIGEKRLTNAKSMGSSTLVTEQETTQKSNQDSFEISFKALYDSLISSADAYTNAVNAETNGRKDLEYANRQKELGLISEIELLAAENTMKSLELNTKSAYYDMVSARASYDAAVNDGIV